MATTTNFGWETPDDTDLVKDGAAAMRTLGNSIDASFVDLKGGTTGQVLAKASNTDLDYTWVAQDDSNAIQNAIVDAKGDLISATAADTPARLAVGTNGQVLTADSTASTGLKWATPTSGSMTLLATGTFAGSQVNFTSISGSYKDLYLVFENVRCDSTSDQADRLLIQFNSDTGSNYNWFKNNFNNTVSGGFGNTSLDGQDVGDYSLGITKAGYGYIRIRDYANTTVYKGIDFQSMAQHAPSTNRFSDGTGVYCSTSAISSIEIKNAAGGGSYPDAGTCLLYGVL